MGCNEAVHHPKDAAKTDEYITLQTEKYKRTINATKAKDLKD